MTMHTISHPAADADTLYGLVGYPLGHSFSARFFSEKFQREQIDAAYLNFEMADVTSLRDFITSQPRLRGLNVTIPHKQAVIPLLDEISDEAAEIGAVNVIRIRRDANGRPQLKGYNSDVIGFSRSLQPLLRSVHRKALVIGTGGASKAVHYALHRLGIDTTPVSRHTGPERLTYADLTPEVMQEHLLIVNCTPVGMFPHTEECPDIPYACLGPDHLLYDLVYNPEETLFMRRGLDRGATVKNGLEMLHLQALAGWEFWQE